MEKLLKRHLYEKCTRIKLMKLTAGFNFMNILRAAFTGVGPKGAKRH